MKVQIIKFESHTYFDLFVVKNIRRERKRVWKYGYKF